MTKINNVYKPWFYGEIKVETLANDIYRLLISRASNKVRKVVKQYEEHVLPWGLGNLATCLQYNLPTNYKVQAYGNAGKIDVLAPDGQVLLIIKLKQYDRKVIYNTNNETKCK